MRTSITVAFGLALLACASGVLGGEDSSVPQPLKDVARFNGNWVGEFTAPFDLGAIKKGNQVTFFLAQ